MFSFFYNFILFLYLLFFLPKVLYERIFYKKKRSNIFQRLGFKKYDLKIPENKFVIWIHSVSVGETKSAALLIKKLKVKFKNTYIIQSTITDTGNREALSLDVDKVIFFPIDFSFVVKRIVKNINLKMLIFVETDLWYNFIKYSKKYGAKVFLVSAKMSDNSFKNFKKFKKFTKNLLNHFDGIFTQNKHFEEKFKTFQNFAKTTGNIKFDNREFSLSENEKINYRKKFFLNDDDKIITIASTHENEEILLLNEIIPLFQKFENLKIFIAPRHPERFLSVEKILRKLSSSYIAYDNLTYKKNNKIILINTLGKLNVCYQLSHIAIIGGSFVPNIGGHNILESIFFHIPTIFGPFMQGQKDLESLALTEMAGIKTEVNEISKIIQKFLNEKDYHNKIIQNCKILEKNAKGSVDKTIDNILTFF